MFAQPCSSATLKPAGTKLELTAPDDWHHHLRDGKALATTVPAAARQFKRAIIMPNLVPPVTTTEAALAYRGRILDALHASGAPAGSFEPLMTLYLTDDTPPDEVRRAAESGVVKAFKLYPAGATTNSASGVTDVTKCKAALQAMEEHGLLLLVHGEVTDPVRLPRGGPPTCGWFLRWPSRTAMLPRGLEHARRSFTRPLEASNLRSQGDRPSLFAVSATVTSLFGRVSESRFGRRVVLSHALRPWTSSTASACSSRPSCRSCSRSPRRSR
jgi:hypothetical protein